MDEQTLRRPSVLSNPRAGGPMDEQTLRRSSVPSNPRAGSPMDEQTLRRPALQRALPTRLGQRAGALGDFRERTAAQELGFDFRGGVA
jgi:hypothetical protein